MSGTIWFNLSVIIVDGPSEYSAEADAQFGFECDALDDQHRIGEPDQWSWTIDTVAPEVLELDGPDDYTAAISATFDFDCSQDGCAYFCQIDDGAVEECDPGVSYGDLEDGAHLFTVYAVDPADNQGPEATVTWTIDTVVPEVTIIAGPKPPVPRGEQILERPGPPCPAVFALRWEASATATTTPCAKASSPRLSAN